MQEAEIGGEEKEGKGRGHLDPAIALLLGFLSPEDPFKAGKSIKTAHNFSVWASLVPTSLARPRGFLRECGRLKASMSSN